MDPEHECFTEKLPDQSELLATAARPKYQTLNIDILQPYKNCLTIS
jgi:hypothetical protein